MDGRSLLQAVEKDGRPLSSLRRISQSLRDPSSCRSETSSQERAAFSDRSPPTTGTPSPSRAPAPRRRSADFGSLASRPAREHGRRYPGKLFFLATRRRRRRSFFPDGPSLSCAVQDKPRPQLRISDGRELRAPGPGSTQPTRDIGSTGPRPGDAHPFRRSGQLAPVAGDAPGASTPPRRREPGR